MRRHPIVIALATVVALIAAVLIFAVVYDFKDVFGRRASAALGRPVTVGSAHLRLFPLRVVLHDLNIPADKPNGEPMMNAGVIDATIAFWPLLSGKYIFRHLDVEHAHMLAVRSADGTSNWSGVGAQNNARQKPKDQAATPALPEIKDLVLDDTHIHYRDAQSKTDLKLDLETRDPGDGGERPLAINGKGSYAGAPTTLALTGGSILTLRDADKPYPLDAKFTSGDTTIAAKGTITDPVHATGLDVTLSVKGKDASDLYRIGGIAIPPTPPYEITGKLDHQGERWIFKNLAWKMGSSDLSGELAWNVSNAKPRLEGKLHAHVIDMDDLAGFIGAAPGKATTPDDVKVAAAEREKKLRAANAPPPPPAPKVQTDKNGKLKPAKQSDADLTPSQTDVADKLVIPDETIDFTKINAMNAEVSLNADKIVDFGIPADRMSVDLSLEDGVLKLKPLTLGVEQGHIDFTVTMTAAKPPVHTDLVIAIDHYPIRRLVGTASESLAKNNTTFGTIGGRVELHGDGDSMHRILAKSNGTVGLISEGGEMSTLLVDLAGLQLAKALGIVLTKDKPTDISCMATDFRVQEGVMTTQVLVIDTDEGIITGKGGINLGTEMINMRIYPKPKKPSIGALRVPLQVSGSFANPSVGPEAGALTLKAGAAVALGVLLTPLGSLLATIETGGGKDANCAALFRQVHEDVHNPPKH
jgi:uncharacterized protein involved in outer membrane biogenesis